MTLAERLARRLRAIPGVAEGSSRFGSGANRAWTIGGREFAHLHSATLIDLRLPRRLQATLRGDPRARFRKSASEWIELEFRSPSDVAEIAGLAAAAARANRKKG